MAGPFNARRFSGRCVSAKFCVEFFATLQTLASGRLGAAMKLIHTLFAANKAEQIDQGCVGWNGLPFAHHALRVDNFASEHGATVHGELQNVDHLFATVHLHVRASGHVESTTLRLLGRFVIEQTPERANSTGTFDGAIVDVDDARIGGGDLLPLCVRRMRRQQGQGCGSKRHTVFQSLKGGVNDSHAPNYRSVHRS